VCTLRLNFVNALRVVEDLSIWYCFSISWLTKWHLGKKCYKFEVESPCCTLLDSSDKYLWEFWGCVYGSKFVGLYLFILVCPCWSLLKSIRLQSQISNIYLLYWGFSLRLRKSFAFVFWLSFYGEISWFSWELLYGFPRRCSQVRLIRVFKRYIIQNGPVWHIWQKGYPLMVKSGLASAHSNF
jgi:hypothetical protein